MYSVQLPDSICQTTLSLAPREGRLVAAPRKTLHLHYAEACARECLSLPASACLSFNYDYSSVGVCQLMGHIEGPKIHVRQVSWGPHNPKCQTGQLRATQP